MLRNKKKYIPFGVLLKSVVEKIKTEKSDSAT